LSAAYGGPRARSGSSPQSTSPPLSPGRSWWSARKAKQTSKLARRVAKDLREAGWHLERLLSDNGNEFKGDFTKTVDRLKADHTRIHAGRPQTNGNVEALHKTILDECWRPAFARYMHPRLSSLRLELDAYLRFYNYDRVHNGRLTGGQIPADIVYGARKMEVR